MPTTTPETHDLDTNDLKLLSSLMKVPTHHMSVGPDAERQHGENPQRLVKQLKKTGGYRGWKLDIDRTAMGLTVTAFILVKLKQQTAETIRSFSAAMKANPQVIALHALSGEHDFMIEFLGRDIPALDNFRVNSLNNNTLVRQTQTMIAFDQCTTGSSWDQPA